MGTKVYDNALDLITFTRASGGTALRKISYGPELVTNGGFDSDINWTLNTNVSISSGTLNFNNVSPGAGAAQTIPFKSVIYRCTLDVSNYSGGTLFFRIRNPSNITQRTINGNGAYSFDLYPSFVPTQLSIVASGNGGNGTCTIDNVSVKEVLFDQPDGTLTLFNHPNNIPRIEYDASGAVKGLLVEEARTNNVTNSEACSFGVTGTATVTVSETPAPFGLSSSVKRVETSVADSGARLPVTILVGGDNHCSVYVRSRTGSDQNLKITASGTVGSTQVAPASGEWVRLGSTVSLGAGPRDMRVLSVGDPIDLDIALPQVELGAFPTSYIPTSGATATRAADIASIPVSAFGYNQKAGSVVIEAQTLSTAVNNHQDFNLVNLSAPANSINSGPRVGGGVAGQYTLWVLSNGSTVALISKTSVISDNTVYKAAWAAAENDFALTVDGQAVVTDAAGAMPTAATEARIGYGTYGRINGHIKSIRYFPRRLSNAQLQELTS